MFRRRRNLSQVELARLLGMRPGPVNNLEKGRNLPSAAVLCKLAAALDVHVDAFFLPEAGATAEGGTVRESHAAYIVSGASVDSVPRAEIVRLPVEEGTLDATAAGAIGRVCDAVLALEDICNAQKCAEIPLTLPFEFSEIGIERLVTRVRALMGIASAVVFDYVELFENAGLRVVFMPLPRGVDSVACYDITNANAFLIVSVGVNVERQLFRLVYELGRIYCMTRSRRNNGPNVPVGAPRRKGKVLNDHRAARLFAALFLQPGEAVGATVRQVGVAPDGWTYEMLLRLKHRFGVSAESFLYRLDELGLIARPLFADFRERVHGHYGAHDHAEPDGTRRILTRNGRIGDLWLRAETLRERFDERDAIRSALDGIV